METALICAEEWGSTMTATNHDDQLGEIYPTMLNELNCTFGVSFSRLRSCSRHGHGFWPSLYTVFLFTTSSFIPFRILLTTILSYSYYSLDSILPFYYIHLLHLPF